MYVVLTVAILTLNALPIIIYGDDIAITKYSIPSIAFTIRSVAYAVIAFLLKNKGNLFVAGKFWFYTALSLTFSENESYTEYKKEFELSPLFIVSQYPPISRLPFLPTVFIPPYRRLLDGALSG